MISVGVIGYGYWGPNLVRNFAESNGAQVVAVSDLRPERLANVNKRYPGIQTSTDYREMLADPRVDAVAISTPVCTHFRIAMEALRAGKHVLVEKPLAANSEEAFELIEAAAVRNLVLMVDHTFVYTGAVRKMRELVTSGELGEIYYFDSVRANLGLFQQDVNVMWDLAVHDLSIMDYVLPCRPYAVSATGLSNVPGKAENIAYMTLFFEGSMIVHVHVNWLAPVKLRRILIGASKKMIVYDDMEQTEKVRVYDNGITVSNHVSEEKMREIRVGYRTGDMWAPKVSVSEALLAEVEHFARCIQNHEKPLTDGLAGLRVVKILEAATQSMREYGQPVRLETSVAAASAGTGLQPIQEHALPALQ